MHDKWAITHLTEDNIVVIQSSKRLGFDDLAALTRDIVHAAATYGSKRFLADLRKATLTISVTDTYNLSRIADQAGIFRGWKIANVFAEVTRDMSFIETIGMNRGFMVKTFDNMDAARAWLLGDN